MRATRSRYSTPTQKTHIERHDGYTFCGLYISDYARQEADWTAELGCRSCAKAASAFDEADFALMKQGASLPKGEVESSKVLNALVARLADGGSVTIDTLNEVIEDLKPKPYEVTMTFEVLGLRPAVLDFDAERLRDDVVATVVGAMQDQLYPSDICWLTDEVKRNTHDISELIAVKAVSVRGG